MIVGCLGDILGMIRNGCVSLWASKTKELKYFFVSHIIELGVLSIACFSLWKTCPADVVMSIFYSYTYGVFSDAEQGCKL